MILKKIQVSHWRSLLNPVSLGPFSNGVNVIHAPNGTGKSSLFEAMRRALFDSHHVTGTEVEAVRPWGRDLAPLVEVEFEEGGEVYRIEKRFLVGASSKLLREEGGRFQPIAEGRQADDRLREILSAEAPGRGLSRQEHWGLAQALWAPQGELELKSIGGSTADSLREALGAQVSGSNDGELEDAIEERYLEFFTKGGKLKKGKNAAPVVELEEQLKEVQKKQMDLCRDQQSYEEAAFQVESARLKRKQSRVEVAELVATVDKTRVQAERYVRLQTEIRTSRQAVEVAHERYIQCERVILGIDTAQKEIQRLLVCVQDFEARSKSLTQELVFAQKDLEEKRGKREAARLFRQSLEKRHVQLNDARQTLDFCRRLEELKKQISKISELDRQLSALRESRSGKLFPESKLISQVRKWISNRDTAEAALKLSQIHLTLIPERELEGIHDTAKDEFSSASPEHPLTVSGDALVELQVEGFGVIRAAGPEGGAEEHRLLAQKAHGKIQELCQPYGSSDPETLQRLKETGDELNQRIVQLEEQRKNILETSTLDDLQAKRAELSARLEDLYSKQPEWKTATPVLSALESDYDRLKLESDRKLHEAEDDFDQQRSRVAALEKSVGEINTQLKSDRERLTAAELRLNEWTRDGHSEEERESLKQNFLMEWQSAKLKSEKHVQELSGMPGNPEQELRQLEARRDALLEQEAKARDEEKSAEGRLETLAAAGSYSKLAEAEESISELKSRVQRESIRMQAAQLLRDTYIAKKNAVIAAVAGPVERHAAQMLVRVMGPRLGAARLGQDFVPQSVEPEIAKQAVALNNLSGGEQEQLYLIVRLALANVLARDARQLVVLDDVLNATDAGRLARLLTLLEEMSVRLQIVILTCHPERYRGLAEAKFFELQSA